MERERSPQASEIEAQLPEIVYVSDLANWLRISEQAVRDRVWRGQLPKPGKVGRRCAWSRGSIVSWARESAAGRPDCSKMTITLRPYPKDPTRFHVDLQVKHPVTEQALRRRIASPKGLDEHKARRWGQAQLEDWLRILVTPGKEDAPTSKTVPPRSELTLARFFEDHFIPTYVKLQRQATQTAYACLWRNHLHLLGDVPLAAIDESAIDRFVADLSERKLQASTINLVLAKLAKMLRWAVKHRRIERAPVIERLKTSPKPRAHYTAGQLAQVRGVLDNLDASDAAVFFLAFEGGLRTGEIAALCWDDVDFEHGVIHIRRTIFRGTEGPPKGTVAEVGLTANLRTVLSRLERLGRRVLYRTSQHTGGELGEHTEHSVRAALNRIQRTAGLDQTGLHILRHSGITFLADQGADVHTLRHFARHSRLQTTEAYLHQSRRRLVQGAAKLFDGNGLATPGNTAGNPS